MFFIALKRLWTRPLLTLLSIVGVMLAVGLVTSIPIFSQAVSFVMLQEELFAMAAKTGRPIFSMRVYVLPSARFPLPLQDVRNLQDHITETVVTEVGVPPITVSRHIETTGLIVRTRNELTPYGEPNTFLRGDINLVVLPGVETRLNIVEGDPMDAGAASDSAALPGQVDVWVHKTTADEMGISPGEIFEVRNLRGGATIPIRIAGLWRAQDVNDRFWFSNPDLGLRGKLLVREDDYERLVEGPFQSQLGFVSWYLILDDSQLAPERMQEYADGLNAAIKIINKYEVASRV